VLRVKRGDVPTLGEVLAEIDDVQAGIDHRLGTGDTPLPMDPDTRVVAEWSIEAHRRHWGWS
jgi:hypothetical protein